MIQKAFLIDGVRTGVGAFGGSLSAVRADDLAAHVLRALMERHPGLDPKKIDDVLMGCANQAGEDNRNVARMASLLAGLPWSVPGETINRLCASGMSAVAQSRRAILAGEGDLFLAGGVEQMTRAPYVMSKPSKAYGTDARMHDSSFGWRFVNPEMQRLYGTEAMGETAENLVERFGIGREDQDLFACNSQKKAAAAQEKGILAEEIVPINIPRRKQDDLIFDRDEFMKPQSSLEGLARLRPAFRKEGSVTAGNASGLNDGAAALLIASEAAAESNGLEPLAEIVASGVSGVEPRIMGIGPVHAGEKALQRAQLGLKDMDVIELNEAFAAQVLACTRQMGLKDNDPRINPNGGAIAIGHPLGMSGARIVLAAARELRRSGGRYALVSMCIGVGQGYAVVLKNPQA
ncbi:MAG: 3-oxoadipyl-CoA thiolase [Flavobacteriia bacterium]|jgi:3-oxoadipyl-CoA thiolase|nr:3-oxoadipyl-CoA thiolase [Flavobacteriia bacterium]